MIAPEPSETGNRVGISGESVMKISVSGAHVTVWGGDDPGTVVVVVVVVDDVGAVVVVVVVVVDDVGIVVVVVDGGTVVVVPDWGLGVVTSGTVGGVAVFRGPSVIGSEASTSIRLRTPMPDSGAIASRVCCPEVKPDGRTPSRSTSRRSVTPMRSPSSI